MTKSVHTTNHQILTGADYFIATFPTDEALAEAIKSHSINGVQLIAEQDRRAGLTTSSTCSLDPGCICFGNWRLIISEVESIFDKEYNCKHDGKTYRFIGVLHGSDDYYYVMWHKDGIHLLSCVDSIENFGFTLKPTEPESINEKITAKYKEINDIELKLEAARISLYGLQHANSVLREMSGLPTIVDDGDCSTCTCDASCKSSCKGTSCGCKKCSAEYSDFLSGE